MSHENSEREPLSLSNVESILAYIPHALGFTPTESAVLLLINDNRLEATLRVDLPPASGQATKWATQVASLVSRVKANSVSAVIYTRKNNSEVLPHERTIEALREVLPTYAIDLKDAWCASDRLWSYADKNWKELDLDALKVHDVNIQMIATGSAPLENAKSIFAVDPWANAEGIRAMAEEVTGTPVAFLNGWKSVLASSAPVVALQEDDALTAFLLASMNSKLVRDLLPLLACFGDETVDELLMEYLATGEAPELMADLISGKSDRAIMWKRVDQLERILHNLLGVAKAEPEYAFKTLLAWIQWAKGRGSLSLNLLSEVLAETDYTLAGLLRQLMSHGIMPSWALSPERAWRPNFR